MIFPFLTHTHNPTVGNTIFIFFGQKILFYSALTEEVSCALESVLPGDKVT